VIVGHDRVARSILRGMVGQTYIGDPSLKLQLEMNHTFIHFSCSFDDVANDFTYTTLFDALYRQDPKL